MVVVVVTVTVVLVMVVVMGLMSHSLLVLVLLAVWYQKSKITQAVAPYLVLLCNSSSTSLIRSNLSRIIQELQTLIEILHSVVVAIF